MKEIKLSQGFVSLVDDEDYDYLMQYNWYAIRNSYAKIVRFYAVSKSIKPKKQVFMHRLLLSAPDNMQIDHIDHNCLNNQRSNLRLCTIRQNSFNKSAYGKSKYKGVTIIYNKNGVPSYRASIRINGKQAYLGTFTTEKAAAIAYDERAMVIHGEFVNLNFPAHRDNLIKKG